MKYRPEMPEQLGSLEHARQVMRALVDWYNDEHYHIGLALLHPVDVHDGRALAIVAARECVLDEVYRCHPERFVRGQPIQKSPPTAAWINPPPMDLIAIATTDRGGRCSLNSCDRCLRIVDTRGASRPSSGETSPPPQQH